MISPILFNIPKINKFTPISNPNNDSISLKQQSDICALSFGSKNKVREFDEELASLNNIRCARCNQHMLSEKKYNLLLEQMSQVKNGKELENLLLQNKQYISEDNQPILTDLNKINKENPDIDSALTLKKIHEHAPKVYAETCQNNINLIKLVTEKLYMSDNNRNVYLKIIDKLNLHKDFYPYKLTDFSAIMNESLRDTDYARKEKLYNKVMLHQTKAFKYYKNIANSNIGNTEPKKALVELGKTLFQKSQSEISLISKNNPKDDDSNKILICKSCAQQTKNNSRYFKASDDPENLKNRFTQYLQDINRAISNNELHVNKNYLNLLIQNLRKTSGNTIVLNTNDRQFLEYKKSFLDFPFEDFENLPCPKCNAKMMTHFQRENVFKKIQESSSIRDIHNIIKENKEYLPPKSKQLADKFQDIFIRDPYITETLLRKQMTDYVRKLDRIELDKFVKLIKEKVNNSELSNDEKAEIYNAIKTLRQFDRNAKTLYHSSKLKELLINSPMCKDYNKIDLKIDTDEFLTIIEILQGPVLHSTKLREEENYSWSKTFAERIFRKSTLTQDHLIARNNGGADDINNKIGLHRECNQLKGKKSLYQWYNEDPQIENNMTNYLKETNKNIKNKKLNNYDDYSLNIANKIYYLCGGRSKIKDEFNNKN